MEETAQFIALTFISRYFFFSPYEGLLLFAAVITAMLLCVCARARVCVCVHCFSFNADVEIFLSLSLYKSERNNNFL